MGLVKLKDGRQYKRRDPQSLRFKVPFYQLSKRQMTKLWQIYHTLGLITEGAPALEPTVKNLRDILFSIPKSGLCNPKRGDHLDAKDWGALK